MRTPRVFFTGCNGFSLLEILIALSLLSVVLVTVIQHQTRTVAEVHESAFETTAPYLAQKKMTEIQTTSPLNPGQNEGAFEKPFSDFDFYYEVKSIESKVLDETAKDMRQIDVSVTDGEGRRFSLRKYVYIPLTKQKRDDG